MNKKILCTTLLSIFSFGAYADNTTELELKKILAQLDPEYTVEEVVEADGTKQFELEPTGQIETITATNDDNSLKISNNSTDIESVDEELIESFDHVFLLNVPIETQIKPNEDIYIYPYRSAIIYNDGKLVSSSPLKLNDSTTFCYFVVEKSGHVRRMKENSKNTLLITGNKSIKGNFSSHINDKIVLEKFETTFSLDNEHLKAIKCLTTEKKLPLTIEDFNRETGNKFNFIFPSIIDI